MRMETLQIMDAPVTALQEGDLNNRNGKVVDVVSLNIGNSIAIIYYKDGTKEKVDVDAIMDIMRTIEVRNNDDGDCLTV